MYILFEYRLSIHMDTTKLKIVFPIALSLLLGFVYSKYKGQENESESMRDYALVQKYLLTGSSSFKSKKPIIWIHTQYDINARSWLDFYSRNTEQLNQPYIYLTIKSVINHCGENFNVCLIDDDSFAKLMPAWNVNLSLVAEPIKSKLRQLAFARLLYTFGGFLMPSTFICFRNLYSLYCSQLAQHELFVGELVDRKSTSDQTLFFPDTKFMGCRKEAPILLDYIRYLETITSTDFVGESDFLGSYSRWMYGKIREGKVGIVTADKLGAKDIKGKSVTIDNLLSNTFIDLPHDAHGLYVPGDEILRRTNYQWFARLSTEQVLASDTMIGKYLLTA